MEVAIVCNIPLFQLDYSMSRPECREYASQKETPYMLCGTYGVSGACINYVKQLGYLDHLGKLGKCTAGPMCIWEVGTV